MDAPGVLIHGLFSNLALLDRVLSFWATAFHNECCTLIYSFDKYLL
jgi:hypothetical protein